MSSLIFCTEPSQVIVATDTLAVSPGGAAGFFTTKAFILPHLRMIMCGTGVAGLLGKWFIRVNDRMVLSGIDNLDYHAPQGLRELWRDHKAEHAIPDQLTATIYHFGFSEEDGLIHSYVYRSASNFESETLGHGIGVKPYCEVPQPYELPADFITMMRQQRENEEARPAEERIYIGGEIQVHHLTEQGFMIYTLARIDDYDATVQAIYENFNS